MIESNYFWTNVFLLAIGTLGIRYSIVAFSARVKFSDRIREIFTFIPAAILPAYIAPMVFYHQGHVAWLMGKERFFVIILATVVCYFTRNLLATITFGLGLLYLLTQYF